MNLSQRLQGQIKEQLGIDASLPISVNRGYWHTGKDVYRWFIQAGNEMIFSYLPMAVAVKSNLAIERDGIHGGREIGRLISDDSCQPSFSRLVFWLV